MATEESASSTPGGDRNRRDEERQFLNEHDDQEEDIVLPQLSGIVSWACLRRALYLWRYVLSFVAVHFVVCGLLIPELFYSLSRQEEEIHISEVVRLRESEGGDTIFAYSDDKQHEKGTVQDEEDWISLLRAQATVLLVVASIVYIADCFILAHCASMLENMNEDEVEVENPVNHPQEVELAAQSTSSAVTGEQSQATQGRQPVPNNSNNNNNNNNRDESATESLGPSVLAAKFSHKMDAYLSDATKNMMFPSANTSSSNETRRTTTFLSSILWVMVAVLFAAAEWAVFATVTIQLPSTNVTSMVSCAITNRNGHDYSFMTASVLSGLECFREQSNSIEFARLPPTIQEWAISRDYQADIQKRHSYALMKDGSVIFLTIQPFAEYYDWLGNQMVVQLSRDGSVVEYRELNATRGIRSFGFETFPEQPTSDQPAETLCGVLWGEGDMEPMASVFCYSATISDGGVMHSKELKLSSSYRGNMVRFRLQDHRLWVIHNSGDKTHLVSYSTAGMEFQEHLNCSQPFHHDRRASVRPDCSAWRWIRVIQVVASLVGAACFLHYLSVPMCLVPVGLGLVILMSHMDSDIATAMIFLLPVLGLAFLGSSLRSNEWPLTRFVSAEHFVWFVLTILGGLCNPDDWFVEHGGLSNSGDGALVALLILVFGGIWILRHSLFDIAAVVLLFWSVSITLLRPQRGKWYASTGVVAFYLVLILACLAAGFFARRNRIYLTVQGRRTWRLLRAIHRQWIGVPAQTNIRP